MADSPEHIHKRNWIFDKRSRWSMIYRLFCPGLITAIPQADARSPGGWPGLWHGMHRQLWSSLLLGWDAGKSSLCEAPGVEVCNLDLGPRGNLSGDLVEQLG